MVRWREVIVMRRSMETKDVAALELVAADGAPLEAFDAGAHIDLRLSSGVIRQYSLYGRSTTGAPYKIAVLRDPNSRGGSIAVHDEIVQGDRIEISAPRNCFPIAAGTSSAILLAGGIGITPILAMAHSLHDQGVAFDLHYSARAPDRMAFRSFLATCEFAGRVKFHFDDGPEAQRLDLTALFSSPSAGTHLYVCGPSGLIDAALRAAKISGWPEDRVHREHFSAEPVQPGGDDGAFSVILAKSGGSVHVSAGQSVVEALGAAGIDIEVSCEQGVCGTCLTRVLEGTPDHRDVFLTPQEHQANNVFTPCCSRAKSESLVLDL